MADFRLSKKSSLKIDRRAALKGGIKVLTALSVVNSSDLLGNSPHKRLAIIGAGMGGIASAYFCGAEWLIDLYESRSKVGGHADSISIEDKGEHYSVDLGAEFFHPDTHPLYWSLLNEIGAIVPTDAAKDLSIKAPASLTIFDARSGKSYFSSGHPFDDLIGALRFITFSGEARKMTEGDAPWNLSMGEWLDNLSIDDDFKNKILAPWLASLSCGNVEMLRRQSARAHLSAFAKTFPKTIFEKPHTYNSKIGLAGYLEMLLARCPNTRVLSNTTVQQLEEQDGRWYVQSPAGRSGPYDAIVVNAPPHISKDFFGAVPWAANIASLLERHEYYPSRLVIHRDPAYMHAKPSYWAVQNAAINGQDCEGSVWIGEIFGEKKGQKLNLFKSWATRREFEPEQILAERRFLHPLSTPDTIQATWDLKAWQGHKNLYFAGHFTTITDLQETALFSAMEVAKALSANSPQFVAFKNRLKREGKDGISYEFT